MRAATGFRRLRVVLAVLVAGFFPGGCALADGRPLTVDDMMKVGGFGSAAVDPEGRWAVYEKLRPYEEARDFSFRTYAFAKSGHQLWRVDLQAGTPPERLPGIDPEPHSYVLDFSASGRFLAVMQYSFGEVRVGAYDMEADEAAYFAPAPAFSRTGDHNPVWVSETELVYAAVPDGEFPLATSIRAVTGRALGQLWEEAWSGQRVTATEARATVTDQSDEQEAGRLVRAHAASGETEVLAEGLFADLRVSADGRRLAALAVSKPRPTDAAERVTYDARRYRLMVFDLEAGTRKALAPGLEFFPYTLAWAPDGRRLAAFGWASDESPAQGRFHVVDTVTGEVTPYQHDGLDLASERERGWLQRPERVMFLADALVVFARNIPPEEAQSPRFSAQDMNDPSLPGAHWYALWPDGRSLNLTSGLAGVSGVPVQAGEGHVTVSARDGVYRIQPGGRRERLTPGPATEVRLASPGTFATRSGVARPEFRGEALLTLKAEGRPKVMMLDLQAGREDAAAVSASPGPGAVPVAGARASGTFLIRADEGPATRLLSAGRGTTAEVDRVNTHLEDVQFGTWQPFSYTVSDPEGLLDPQVLESCVLLPPGYSQGRPLPLIVDVYPNIASGCGERGAGISYSDPHSSQLWAGKGFAYVKLAAPRDLIRTAEGPIAGLDEITAAGVQELVKMGLADPDRLILHGYSQGGVSALYVAAKSDLYAAVIAKNGWADLFSHYFGPGGVFSILYPEFLGAESGRYDAVIGTDFGIGRTPFEAPETFYENSPVFLAPRINIPVLLMHSDMDIFSMSQFDEMFGALKRAGKDARYVRYWGEGHGPSSPANIRDMWQRTDAFLAEHDLDP